MKINSGLREVLSFCNLEFVELDENLNILEYSHGSKRFAEHPERLRSGQDSRFHFPELIGLEDVLNAMLMGEQDHFHLTAILRDIPDREPVYFNLYVIAKNNPQLNNHHVIILFEDVTSQNVLEQKYVQITNELTLVNQNLSAYKKYLQYIIQYMADALFVTNSTGQIEQCNRAAQNLLEASETDLLNQSIHQIFKEVKLFPKVNSIPEDVYNHKKLLLQNIEVNFHKKSGVNLTILFNCSVIELDDGQKHFIYIARDITKRKQAEQEMEIALRKERELNELKSNFISMTSHEFRTPLTIILSSAELLEFYNQKKSDDRSLKYINQIQNSVENLLEMLDNLLLLGKADANKLSLNKKLMNLETVCSSLVEELELGSENKRICLINEAPDLTANMDEKLLRHILSNLLLNALKYSPNQTPVSLKVRQEAEAVIFEVKDQGIGICPEDKKHLFELFHRGQNVANIPGTGLGLAIVNKAVEIYGGNVMVSSELGVGTTFKVKLPLN